MANKKGTFSSNNQPTNRKKAVPKEVKEAMRVNNKKLQDLMDKYISMDLPAIKTAAKQGETALDRIIAGIVVEAVKLKQGYIHLLFDRLAGKPKEEIDITATIKSEMDGMSDEDFANTAESAVKYLRAIK